MRTIDLTHPFYEGMPQYREEWYSSANVRRYADPHSGKQIFKLDLMVCSGTHIKAPRFYRSQLKSLEHLPLDRLISYTSIVHISDRRAKDFITYEDMQHFYLKPGDGVIIHTGWSEFWEKGQYYMDFPVITSDAAEYLAYDRNVPFIGADVPFSSEVQRILLGSDRFLIENLTNLDTINLNRFLLIALPLNIYGSSAAPARVVAVENENLII